VVKDSVVVMISHAVAVVKDLIFVDVDEEEEEAGDEEWEGITH
jgi:hypothetical protein